VAVFDAFGANQGVGNLLNVPGLAFHNKHLQTIIVVEVNVHGGENVLMMIVLHVGQLFVEHAHMVVIDEIDRSHHIRVG
jgi:hypothetical protein